MNNLNYELDKEELQILNDIENNNYVSLKDTKNKEFKKQMANSKIVATNTINKLTKKKTYTMKLIENDVEKIKSMALEKGLPYQTFIASLIHQIASKQIEI